MRGSAKITNGLEYLAMLHTAESPEARVSRKLRMELEICFDAGGSLDGFNLGGKILTSVAILS